MRKLFLAGVLLLCSTSLFAYNYKVGVSTQSGYAGYSLNGNVEIKIGPDTNNTVIRLSSTTANFGGLLLQGTTIAATSIKPGVLPSNIIASSIAVAAVGIPQIKATGIPSSDNWLDGSGTWSVPAGAGDMVLASTQTSTGKKTFNIIEASSVTITNLTVTNLTLLNMTNIEVFLSADLEGMANGATTLIPFNSESVDSLDEFNTTTSTATLLYGGTYEISVKTGWAFANANTFGRVRIMIDHNHVGASRYDEAFIYGTPASAINFPSLWNHIIVSLSAGDKIYSDAWCDSGANQKIKGANNVYTRMTIRRLY